MATILASKNRFIVQLAIAGKRRSISLGRMPRHDAKVMASHIDHLAVCQDLKSAPHASTVRWLAGIGDRLHVKLSRLGLSSPRWVPQPHRLGAYFDAYIKKRTDLAPASISNLRQVKASAVEYFRGDRELSSITRGDVKDWRRHLSDKLAEATVAMHVKKMRQVYADACDRNIIAENPFKAVMAGSQSNESRDRYIPTAWIAGAIGKCPDREWRLVFALSRFAGLRVPSEIKALRWTDVDFDSMRMLVTSQKTKRYKGKGTRVVPISPELMPHLLEAHESAPAGSVYVLEKLRGPNLATTAMKIVRRAGYEPWPKFWHNLRASCETDWASILPIHAACAMIGNSAAVAVKHYLRITEAHFEIISGSRAAKALHGSGTVIQTSGERQGENQRQKENFGDGQYPQGGSHLDRVVTKNLHGAHRALQKALHSAQGRLANQRRRMIRNLSLALTDAKSRARERRR